MIHPRVADVFVIKLADAAGRFRSFKLVGFTSLEELLEFFQVHTCLPI